MAFTNKVNATSTGFQSVTSGGVWNGRTLTAGTGISISNGDGTAGNPTISATGGTGSVVQEVRATSTTAVACGGTNIAVTGTTPTTANSTSVISLAITPTSATNILKFNFCAPYGSDTNSLSLFLFSGTTFVTGFCHSNTSLGYFDVSYYMVAGTTSSTTFNIRGASSSGVFNFLQSAAGVALYNGVGNTVITFTITEVTP